MAYKDYIRVTEGNNQLAVSIDAFMKRRDKITADEWKKQLRPIMRDTQNSINVALKNLSDDEFQAFNLKRINSNINVLVAGFEARFNAELQSGMEEIAEFTRDSIDFRLPMVNLTAPATVIAGEQMISAIIPLTDQFTRFFAQDMAKIIKTEITNGIFQQKTINEVAKSINEKFDSSNMSYERAERIANTEMLTASSMAEEIRNLETEEINPTARKILINSHKPGARIGHLKTERVTRAKPIKLSEKFTFFGEGKTRTQKASFPRSPELSAGHRVYCGCTSAIINAANTEDIPNIGERRAA